MNTPFPRTPRMSISQCAAACAFAFAAFGLCTTATAAAAEKHPKAEKVVKATKGKKARGKKAAVVEEEHPLASTEPDPDLTGSVTVDFDCELGNKVTIYTNEADSANIALRWKKRLHRMTRVGTSTGASRFENTTFGLVWIGIPAKSMLLDSKANRQLANECKNAEQSKPVVTAEMGVTEKAGATEKVGATEKL
jgi:hypothetical protein